MTYAIRKMETPLKIVPIGMSGASPLTIYTFTPTGGVTAPIVGASKMSHLKEAVTATEIELSEEEMAFLEEPYQPHVILGHN